MVKANISSLILLVHKKVIIYLPSWEKELPVGHCAYFLENYILWVWYVEQSNFRAQKGLRRIYNILKITKLMCGTAITGSAPSSKIFFKDNYKRKK